jgi:hypothetical protein
LCRRAADFGITQDGIEYLVYRDVPLKKRFRTLWAALAYLGEQGLCGV